MSNKVYSELAYVPMSEERVVARLIKERAIQDASYYPKNYPAGGLSTDGVFALNEDVICIYASLDSQIERADLSPAEETTVKKTMEGYTIADIAEHYGKTRQTFEILFKRAVRKIVKRNNADWEEVTGGRLDDD